MTAGLPLMKSLLTTLAKNVLLPFGLSAGMSAVDAAIQKKLWIRTAALIILNEYIKYIMKRVKLPEKSELLEKRYL